MSKMSQLHAELTQQASELGFESIEQALANGYEVDYDNYKLVEHKLGWSETVEYLAKEQEKAHEAWLKKRDEVISSLNNAIWHDYKLNGDRKTYTQVVMQRAIDFIQKECHD